MIIYPVYYQGLIEPPKAARGHVTCIDGEVLRVNKIRNEGILSRGYRIWFVVPVRQVLKLVKVLGLAEGTEEAVFFRLDGVSMPKLVGSPFFTFPLNPRQVFRTKSV